MAEREPFTHELREAVLQAHKHTCQYCMDATAAEVDHIWPVAKGGTNDFGNLIAACRSCNRRKRAGRIHERYLALLTAIADEKRNTVERILQAKLAERRDVRKGEFVMMADHFGIEWRIIWMPKQPDHEHVERYERAFRDLARASVENYDLAEQVLGGLSQKDKNSRATIKHALDINNAQR